MQRLTLFQNTNEPSPPLDPGFLGFSIPSAENLYHEIISRDEYELVSQLSLKAIEKILAHEGCDIEDFAKEPDIKILSETHYHYIFYFKGVDFGVRRRWNVALNELRQTEANKKNLFLDTGTLKLHLTNDESYAFDAKEIKSILPNAYRALCIYDLIVTELYHHNLKRKDNNYKNYLISDYLSVHAEEFAGFGDSYRSHFNVCGKLQKCLSDVTCDRRAADALALSFNEAIFMEEDKNFNRGILTILPLTPAAWLMDEPNYEYYGELNRYSYHYCSLIQYRYLMDLKCLFSSVNENEMQKIKDHMARWESFKRQPLIVKYESLVNKVENIRWENREGVGKCSLDSWESCYWEERIRESGERVVCIKAFNSSNAHDRLFNREFVMKVQEELKQILVTERCNIFARGDRKYQMGYFLTVNQHDLEKCPLKSLLTYSEHAIKDLKNPVLQKLTLSNLQFFQTKPAHKWLGYLDYEPLKHRYEMEEFIWMLAAWVMIKEWVCHHKKVNMPMDVLWVITDFLKGLLAQEYHTPQASTKRLQ